MGFLSTIKGLLTGAEDDLKTANEIYAAAKDEGRELTQKEIDQIDKLMDMREDKIDRARRSGAGGLDW